MGSSIEKAAFQPPNPEYTRSVAEKNKDRFEECKTTSGLKVSFIQSPYKGPNHSGLSVLFCHGNAVDLGTGFPFFIALSREMKADVFAFDYSGYGLSSGTPTETNSYACVDAIFRHMTESLKIPRQRIVVFGQSLGSGIATDLAARQRGLGGLILMTPLTTAVSVMNSAVLSFMLSPVDRFTNKDKIKKVVDYPILIVHGTEDEVVPFKHGQQLYELALSVNKATKCLWLQGCGHNNIPSMKGPEFYRELSDFVALAATKP